MSLNPSSQSPSRKSLFEYSVLALPLAFAGLPLYIHAPDFYTRDLGLSIGLIGLILMGVRVFDTVQDPVIGYISDKHAQSRLWIMAGGAALLVVGMAALFYGTTFGIPVPLWFGVSLMMATTGFSIVTINLNVIGGFWHDDPAQRTRISAWRESMGLIGLLVASVLPAVLQNARPAEEVFRILFWIFAVVLALSFVLFMRFMQRTFLENRSIKTNSIKGFSFLPILMGADRAFFGVCFLAHLAAAVPGVMVMFFIRDYLGTDSLTGLFLLLYFVSGAALMTVWVKLAERIGKQQAWLMSMLLAVATFSGVYFIQPGDVIAYGVVCVLSGMALGADLALPPSILADRVTRQNAQSEGTQYYALIAFLPKAALAIASGFSFLVLDSLGFVAGAQNSAQAMQGVLVVYALVPCVIKLIAAVCLWRMNKREGIIYV